MRRFVIAAISLAAMSGGAMAADRAGAWQKQDRKTSIDYVTFDQNGAEFRISCDDTGTGGAMVWVRIAGRELLAGGFAQLGFANRSLKLRTPNEYVATATKRESNAFKTVWQMVRKGGKLKVELSDFRKASFSLDGASKVLPAKACLTTFDSAR